MTNRQFDRLAERTFIGMAEDFLPHQAHEFSAAFQAELRSHLPENGTKATVRRPIRVPRRLLSGAAACLVAAVGAAFCLNRLSRQPGVTVQTSTPEIEEIRPNAPAVIRWADFFDSGEYPPYDGEQLTLMLPVFPDTEFRWRDGTIYAAENGEETPLIYGMPIWNAYFTDLSGDGYPELCTCVSFGSGIVDEHIEVYDYHNKQLFTLWDRMEYDYWLGYDPEQDTLTVTRRSYPSYPGYPGDFITSDKKNGEIGRMVLKGGELCFEQKGT